MITTTLPNSIPEPAAFVPNGATVPELPKIWSTAEQEELELCEVIIERGMLSFIEVATALSIVREKRLWRKDYASWELYLEGRWGFSVRRARQLLQAASDIKTLGLDQAPAGAIDYAMPASEKHVRLLRRLPEQGRRDAWYEAVRTAGHKGVTIGHLETIIRKRTNPAAPDNFPPTAAVAGEQSKTLTRSRADILREQADLAIRDVRELLALAGTADSTKAAELNLALEKLQDYRDHITAKQKLYLSRA